MSYMSSRQNESGYQDFKIGIYVENETDISAFLDSASRVCPVKVLHYDKSEKILDNTVFYLSFAETLAQKMKLNEKEKEGLLIASNKMMQTLDEEGSPFYKTFDYISRLAAQIRRYKGARFQPRITKKNNEINGKDEYLCKFILEDLISKDHSFLHIDMWNHCNPNQCQTGF